MLYSYIMNQKRFFWVFFVVVVMYAKTYLCSDFLYAKMKAPELQAREGLVSRVQEPGYTALCKQTGVFESRPRGVCKCICLSKQPICSIHVNGFTDQLYICSAYRPVSFAYVT